MIAILLIAAGSVLAIVFTGAIAWRWCHRTCPREDGVERARWTEKHRW
jgi:hypothetical protein